ncbi:UNVERIFIED_CONTAM: hypothetical protein K2H54_037963 [Gekko kuhli]
MQVFYTAVIPHWNIYIISNIIRSFEISTYKKPSLTLISSPLQVYCFELNVPHGKYRNLILNSTEPIHSPHSSYGVNTGSKTTRLLPKVFSKWKAKTEVSLPPPNDLQMYLTLPLSASRRANVRNIFPEV